MKHQRTQTTILVILKVKHEGDWTDAVALVSRALDVGSLQEDVRACARAMDQYAEVVEPISVECPK